MRLDGIRARKGENARENDARFTRNDAEYRRNTAKLSVFARTFPPGNKHVHIYMCCLGSSVVERSV